MKIFALVSLVILASLIGCGVEEQSQQPDQPVEESEFSFAASYDIVFQLQEDTCRFGAEYFEISSHLAMVQMGEETFGVSVKHVGQKRNMFLGTADADTFDVSFDLIQGEMLISNTLRGYSFADGPVVEKVQHIVWSSGRECHTIMTGDAVAETR